MPLGELDAGPYYLPNLIAAIAASIGVLVASVGPFASVSMVLTLSGGWFHGTPTLVLASVSAVALFTLLNRGRAGFGPRWVVPLAWVGPIAGLVCLVIAVIDIHEVVTASHQYFGVQIEWGLWLVTVCSVVLCATGSVVALQVSKLSEGSEAWTRTAVTIAALVVLGGVIYFTARPQVVQTQGPQPPNTETVTNTPTRTETVMSPSPTVAGAPPQATLPPYSTPCQPVFGAINGYTTSAAGIPPPGSPSTSCAFAEEVRKAYGESGPRGASRSVSAWSPVMQQPYPMVCAPNGTLVVCTGGNNAVVYIY